MQAIVFHEHGGPEVLRVEDVPQPTPEPGEVLLRVRAIAVNRSLDCEVRSRPGALGPIPMPHIPGSGPAGEVAGLGEGVQECHPGDRVVSINVLWCGVCRPCLRGQNNACVRARIQGVHTQGGYAEFVLAPARNLTRFLQVERAPLDTHIVERALKLIIRQRKNSLFYATEHSAYIASMLTSLIATCLHAGVNALEYLVTLQEHRAAVFGNPAAWLPWNYHTNLAPP